MSQENVEIVRRCWVELEQDPPRVSLELFDEDVVIQNPPEMPMPGPFHGHAGVQVWVNEIWDVLSDLHHEIEDILEGPDGDTVVSVQRTQAHMRHTGIPVDVPWAAVWTFRAGKIFRAHGYMRKAEALEAAGLGE
jgi:ketosteroid isomerase-like protein